MKAIQITAPSGMKVIDVNAPQLKRGDVLLKIHFVGFCGSDLNTFLGRNLMALNPVIPGHEIGATIEKIGEDVPDFLKVGMTVTVNPYTNCGKCASCRNGRVNACEHNETLGVQRDGAMKEFLAVPWEKVIPAKELTPRDCALIEPMSVGFHAVSRAQITDIDIVMVIGCGMIGMGAIIRAALRGATVIAVDLDDYKLELAKRIGAKYAINSKTENVHERLQQLTDGFGPDVVIEAVGSPATYVTAVEEVGFTGRITCIGYSKSDVTFQTKLFVQKELDIRGSRNALPADFRAVIRYLEQKACPVNELITETVKPEQALDAMQRWASNPGKVFRILVSFA
jgi:threonine dehydrogenase-like Zn-dependent dehydrogenase